MLDWVRLDSTALNLLLAVWRVPGLPVSTPFLDIASSRLLTLRLLQSLLEQPKDFLVPQLP